jgi:hypothetical protein
MLSVRPARAHLPPWLAYALALLAVLVAAMQTGFWLAPSPWCAAAGVCRAVGAARACSCRLPQPGGVALWCPLLLATLAATSACQWRFRWRTWWSYRQHLPAACSALGDAFAWPLKLALLGGTADVAAGTRRRDQPDCPAPGSLAHRSRYRHGGCYCRAFPRAASLALVLPRVLPAPRRRCWGC